MSCYVGSALVILLLYLDDSVCSKLTKSEDLEVVKGDKVSVIANRTIVENGTSLEVQQGDERKFEGIEKGFGATLVEESRKKKQNKNEKGFMEKMLPMMVIPFMVSTSIIPLMLISLKVLILKSAFIAKIAIILILLNMFRRRTSGEGGVFNHNVMANDIAMQHYGYYGDEEYGAYVNRKRRKRSFT